MDTTSENGNRRHSIEEFISSTRQRDKGHGLFELESRNMLEVNLDGLVWTKMGSMVAYQGEIKFEREGLLDHGVSRLLKRTLSGEGGQLTKATGRGRIYLADRGKEVQIINLTDDAISINGNDLLAFEDGLNWDIKMMKKVTSMLSGGLFNVRLEGTGMVALTSHFQPLTLLVRPGHPVITDPNATIAWSGHLQPRLKTMVSLKTFFGRGSGESIQMVFDGEGFVVVQPFEEQAVQVQPAQGS